MNFKEWLVINEDGGDDDSDWFYGSYLRPSDAFDWPDAWPYPADFMFLQSRWKKERALGRKFYNIDLDDVLKTKYISIYSNTMPNEGWWVNKEDSGPNLTVDFDAKLELRGVSKSADVADVLWKINPVVDKTKELNKLFGNFEPKYYEVPADFDKPWYK